jgi:hypothetical protein
VGAWRTFAAYPIESFLRAGSKASS